jgi:hypothetical protein
MGQPYRSLYAPDGLARFAAADRVFTGLVAVTYDSGAPDAAATAVVTWTEPLPTPYSVLIDLPEAATAFASDRTELGFTLNVNPPDGDSLVGGTASCFVIA